MQPRARGLRWWQEGLRLLLGNGLLHSTGCFLEGCTEPQVPTVTEVGRAELSGRASSPLPSTQPKPRG